uniref:Uncharacterized protein n=1 Tax=Rhizophagus irregularis (strain DAOM 181602 / DAOM 197198 / MUCL 43194) TaxID=747089 RepID=U9US22_RHIID
MVKHRGDAKGRSTAAKSTKLNIEGEKEKERGEIERRKEEKREKERREKRNNNNRQNDLARLLEQEERNTDKRRERDRREQDKEQEENENDENESEEEIPVQFGAMTNQLQICNWLVLHPSVLHLANKMLDASTKQPSTNLPLTTLTSSTLSASDNNVKSIPNFKIDIATLLHYLIVYTDIILCSLG